MEASTASARPAARMRARRGNAYAGLAKVFASLFKKKSFLPDRLLA
jgi:hypothetical protein